MCFPADLPPATWALVQPWAWSLGHSNRWQDTLHKLCVFEKECCAGQWACLWGKERRKVQGHRSFRLARKSCSSNSILAIAAQVLRSTRVHLENEPGEGLAGFFLLERVRYQVFGTFVTFILNYDTGNQKALKPTSKPMSECDCGSVTLFINTETKCYVIFTSQNILVIKISGKYNSFLVHRI